MITKIIANLLLGIVVYIFMFGFCCLLFQIILETPQIIFKASYIVSGIATFIFLVGIKVTVTNTEEESELLDS